MGNDTNYSSLIALVGILSVLIATVYLAMNSTSFSQVRSNLRSSYLPTGMLDYGEKGKILKTMGFVYGVRNDFSRYKHSPPDSERPGLFKRKREVGGQVYVANPGSIYKLPSSLAVSNLRNRGAWPLVSVVLYERALLDPEVGIVNNAYPGGMGEERPDHFRREIQHSFDIDGIFELRVDARGEQGYFVDGYSVSAPYTGKYFNNQAVELAVQHANGSRPVVWDVGGEKIAGNPIRFEVTSDIEVRLVSAELP